LAEKYSSETGMQMKQIFFLLMAAILLQSQVLKAQDEDSETHVWRISDQLKGTPRQLQHMVNGSVEEAWARLADARQALALKQEQIATESAAISKSVHETQTCKTQLALEKQAEAELKQAREQQDIPGALNFGGQANLAKQEIKKLEDKAMRNDTQLSQSREFAADYAHKVTDAEASFLKSAQWRSRIVHSVRYGCSLTWPINDGEDCCFNYGRVVTSKNGQIEFESEAEELIPDTEQKNARGDGIGIATYHVHPIHVVIDTPTGVSANPGAVIPIKGAYKIAGSPDDTGEVPIYHAQPDPNGGYGVLLRYLNTVKGPPKAMMDKIDDEVDLSEAKALEEMNKKSF
jgi:hypothetical protein